MISCKRATELMSQRMDRRLSFWQRLVLRVHLLMCDGCRQFDAQMKRLREFSRRFNSDGLPAEASDEKK